MLGSRCPSVDLAPSSSAVARATGSLHRASRALGLSPVKAKAVDNPEGMMKKARALNLDLATILAPLK